MHCSNCNKEIQANANFCEHCGIQRGGVNEIVQEEASNEMSSKLKSAYTSVGRSLGRVSSVVGSMANTVAMEIGDLNGDGKIDAEDFKIATSKAKEIGAATANEAIRIGKEALNSELVKDTAAAAVVGAAIAIPIPVIGPVAGATIGAGMGIYKNITK